jgi:hypothetical protein
MPVLPRCCTKSSRTPESMVNPLQGLRRIGAAAVAASAALLIGAAVVATTSSASRETVSHPSIAPTIPLRQAPTALRRGCERAARRLNVSIYCPERVPARWKPQLCVGCNGTFSATGWFPAPTGYVGTPGEPTGHFTVWAARPRFIRDGYVGCTNGKKLGRLLTAHLRMTWLRCPAGSSLDSGHILLQWTSSSWVYALSLHTDSSTNRRLLRMIARHLDRISPS